MSTWLTVLILVLGITVKLLSSPPSALVAWVLGKFALHPKLKRDEVSISFNGKIIEGEEKNSFIDFFNEAYFLNRNHIFPGDEEKYINPTTNIIPYVVVDKSRKYEVKFYLYCEEDKVFVVKQKKKKLECYNLKSAELHNLYVSNI